MQFSTSLIISSILAVASAGRDYDRRATEKLVHRTIEERGCEGWSPLPCKPSLSQCTLALERIVKQPQSCAQKYLSPAARNVYSPIYNWFVQDTDTTNYPNIEAVAQQFALDNGVGVKVVDAFGFTIADINTSGEPVTLPTSAGPIEFSIVRTWPLNYATFVRGSENSFLAQNVWSSQGKLLTIIIIKENTVLPLVC